MSVNNLIIRKYDFYGRRLLNEALNGYYYFDDDEIEDEIYSLCEKYQEYSFEPEGKLRSRIYLDIIKKKDIWEKICLIAMGIFI